MRKRNLFKRLALCLTLCLIVVSSTGCMQLFGVTNKADAKSLSAKIAQSDDAEVGRWYKAFVKAYVDPESMTDEEVILMYKTAELSEADSLGFSIVFHKELFHNITVPKDEVATLRKQLVDTWSKSFDETGKVIDDLNGSATPYSDSTIDGSSELTISNMAELLTKPATLPPTTSTQQSVPQKPEAPKNKFYETDWSVTVPPEFRK